VGKVRLPPERFTAAPGGKCQFPFGPAQLKRHEQGAFAARSGAAEFPFVERCLRVAVMVELLSG
jgi:hypothetical protein